MRFLSLTIVFCFVLTSSVVYGDNRSENRTGELIQTTRVSTRNLSRTYESFGPVKTARQTDIVSYAKGIISDIWVKNGEAVSKGQKLVSIEGYYKIKNQKFSSLSDSQEGNDIVKYSPTNGYISSLKKVPGNVVIEGEILLSVLDVNNLIVRTEVFDNILDIKEGQKVKVVAEEKMQEGIVTAIALNVNARTGGRMVEIQLVQEGLPKFLVGEFVKVIFVDEHKHVLSVPEESVLNKKGQTVVFVKERTGYKKRQVEAGIHFQGYVEILSGLKQEDTVVTNGAYELLNQDIGEKIKIED